MPIQRTLFSPEHDLFRATVRRFVEQEIAPHHARWEREGVVSREVWRKAGAAGLLLTAVPEEYGGAGGDYLFGVILAEELARGVYSGPAFNLQSNVIAPYILHYGSEAQKRRWLPRMAKGEIIAAIAMTEPGAGTDLQAIRTTAIRDGEAFVLNGSKTFISNGQLADLVVVAAKTDAKQGAKGISLLLVEASSPGFERGRKLEKVGMKAQDTSELSFSDVRVPVANLLGEEGRGFKYLMQLLPQERLGAAVGALALAEASLEWTIAYTKERKAFGQAISDFQHNRFALAEMKTELQIARVFLDRCIELHRSAALDVETAAMAKFNMTELEGRVIDRCVQMFGGYGYMWEYPIARAWADARVQRILAGTNEIMKELVARTL